MRCEHCKKHKWTMSRNPPNVSIRDKFWSFLGFKGPIELCDECYKEVKDEVV